MSKLIGGLLVMVAIGWIGSANAVSYEYRADSFSLNGVVVEEFNSSVNTFGPWLGGTVTYQDGHAVFTDPGILIPIPDSNLYYEYSGIAYQTPESGGSDFTAQSTWSSDYLPEPPGGFFGHYYYDPFKAPGGRAFAITMSNFSEGVAGAFEDALDGWGIGFGVVTGDTGLVVETQNVAFYPTDITGDIIFRLIFDSDSKQITGEYSLNGGADFESPFESYTTSGLGSGRHVLYGDPIGEVPIPAAAWLFGSALLGLGAIKRRKS